MDEIMQSECKSNISDSQVLPGILNRFPEKDSESVFFIYLDYDHRRISGSEAFGISRKALHI